MSSGCPKHRFIATDLQVHLWNTVGPKATFSEPNVARFDALTSPMHDGSPLNPQIELAEPETTPVPTTAMMRWCHRAQALTNSADSRRQLMIAQNPQAVRSAFESL